jgi:PA-IL-like protein
VATITRRIVFAATLAFGLPVGLLADTLILRDGTRVRGELIAIRNGTVEFEERRSTGAGRTLRINRDEIARIEFDDATSDDYNRGFGAGTGRGTGGGMGRAAGQRERTINVAANTAWNDTGIDVRPGQTIAFEASGDVTWGPSRRDGPAGERNSPSNPNRPMPNRPAAALIGKVGEGEDYFFIGDDTGQIRVRNGGRLYLGVNDDVLNDNRGAFRVVVYY